MSLTVHTTEVFHLPRFLRKYWGTKRMAEQKITEASVLALVREHKITASKGAELLAVPLQDFLELMSEHQIPVLDYRPGEIEQDLKALRKSFSKAKSPK